MFARLKITVANEQLTLQFFDGEFTGTPLSNRIFWKSVIKSKAKDQMKILIHNYFVLNINGNIGIL